MSNAFASVLQARPGPTFGRPVHRRGSPLDYGPVLLLMPFGFHLTMDTLPSGTAGRWGQVRLGCIRLSLSCPFRLFHTFLSLRPARFYPRFWIQRPSFERWRDLNPPEQRAAQRAYITASTASSSTVTSMGCPARNRWSTLSGKYSAFRSWTRKFSAGAQTTTSNGWKPAPATTPSRSNGRGRACVKRITFCLHCAAWRRGG